MLVDALEKDGVKVKYTRFPGTSSEWGISYLHKLSAVYYVFVVFTLTEDIHRQDNSNRANDQQLFKWQE